MHCLKEENMPKEFVMTFSEDSGRPETGVCHNGADWPGIFIRGDNSMNYALALKSLIDGSRDPWDMITVQQLEKLLRSCNQSETVSVGENDDQR